jgi:hypothetical protein
MGKLWTFAGLYLAIGAAYAVFGFIAGGAGDRTIGELVELTAAMILGWPFWLVATYIMPLFCGLTPYACL